MSTPTTTEHDLPPLDPQLIREFSGDTLDMLLWLNELENVDVKDKKVDETTAVESVAFFQAHSLLTVFGDLILLYTQKRHISVAILGRSITECMANIAWLHQGLMISGDEGARRGTIFLEQSEEVYRLTRAQQSRVQSLQYQGAGSIVDRLKIRGDGWPLIYSHMSSYAHMDTGYVIHYLNDQITHVLDLCLLESTIAVVESLEMLIDLLPWKEGYKEQAKRRLNPLSQHAEAILRDLVKRGAKVRK